MSDPISRFIAARAAKPFGGATPKIAPNAKGLEKSRKKPAGFPAGKASTPPARAPKASKSGVGPVLPTPAAVTKGSKGAKKAKGRKGAKGATTHIHIHLTTPTNPGTSDE